MIAIMVLEVATRQGAAKSARPDVGYSLRLHLESDDERVNRERFDERQAKNQTSRRANLFIFLSLLKHLFR
jgi:hypothetical protein